MQMIPKTIHFCWFGGKKLPSMAKRCIHSWKKFFPGYEIKMWSESNFDVNIIPYTSEAYAAKRYAFVSDYARYYILYNYGGIYFDTDVAVLKSMQDIIERGGYMGFESPLGSKMLYVNAGLGMAAEAGNIFLKEMLEVYGKLHFINPDGSHNLKSIVKYTSELLVEKGLIDTDNIQTICGINIYPKEYFNPYNPRTKRIEITEKTYTVHYFAGSWITRKERFMQWVESHFGKKGIAIIHSIYTKTIKRKGRGI